MFKINVNNEFYIYDGIMSKQSITSEINFKLPFMFNSPHIQVSDSVMDGDNYEYRSRPILEPFVRFETNAERFRLKKKENIPLNYHNYFRSFYLCKKGHAKAYIIHPKYKDNFIQDDVLTINKSVLKFIKTNKDFIVKDLHKDDVLFIPNYWYIFIESKSDQTQIELLQYKSMLNNLCFFMDKFKSKSNSIAL